MNTESAAMRRTGLVMSGLVALFLFVDGGARVAGFAPYVEGLTKFGYSAGLAPWIGLSLLIPTILYVVPRTAVLGAILVTGYLGGATATQVRVDDPWWLFPVALGVMTWGGLWLRYPRLREWVPVINKLTTLALALGLLASPHIADAQAVGPRAVGHRVQVNGMSMYYEVSGQGEPIVVLHGAYMNIPTMGAIIPRLARTHKVYALEFQGHGRTTDIDRPITYPNLADDVATFMDSVHLAKADVFGYSMGAGAGLQLAIRHPAKVNKLIAASVAYDTSGLQPEFKAMIPQMTVEMFTSMPFAAEYRKLAPNPNGFPELVRKLIALEREPMSWGEDVKKLKTPVLIIGGDADGYTLEHLVSLFRLLGGGVMGDMGKPLPASRLAILPATSHTAVITQVDLLMAFIEPFLKGVTPKGFFGQ